MKKNYFFFISKTVFFIVVSDVLCMIKIVNENINESENHYHSGCQAHTENAIFPLDDLRHFNFCSLTLFFLFFIYFTIFKRVWIITWLWTRAVGWVSWVGNKKTRMKALENLHPYIWWFSHSLTLTYSYLLLGDEQLKVFTIMAKVAFSGGERRMPRSSVWEWKKSRAYSSWNYLEMPCHVN